MILSLHRYELQDAVDGEDLIRAFETAERRGLFEIPGLTEYRLIRGIKGDSDGDFAAIWEYRDREQWEAVWGSPEDPIAFDDYPEAWQTWEEELLDPLLVGHPDEITFSSWEVLARGEGL